MGGRERARPAAGWGANPIWLTCVRSRLRPRHLVSWGVVVLSVTAFVSLITYMTMTEQQVTTAREAAKAVLPGVIVIQAVLLMMMGTGAVAAGVARERDEGLLDYQRMTPMRPTAKILGYLFGLPVREYALVGMTMPFVAWAAWASGFSLLTLGHFYAVFFTSVWVYHMTALMAGMVSPKPRAASMTSVGLVVVLYFVLPNLSRVGITFFEFLTIRPTFFGLIQQELPERMRAPVEASGIDSFRAVPFFGGLVHPTLYTLLVQGFVLCAMFSMVHRKWRDGAAHVVSKAGALAVYAGVAVFVLGSVWAVVEQEDAYRRVFEAFTERNNGDGRIPETLELLLLLSGMVLGASFVLLVAFVTPSKDVAVEGWRRARKLGRTRLGWNSDAASSLPVTLAMLAISLGCGIAVLRLAEAGGGYFEQGPSLWSRVCVALAVVGSGLFVQGVRERFSLLVFSLVLFVVWVLPMFAMMILYAAFEAFELGTYIGLPCPAVSVGYAVAYMMHTSVTVGERTPEFLPPGMSGSIVAITATGAMGYALAGAAVQGVRAVHRRRLRRVGMGE